MAVTKPRFSVGQTVIVPAQSGDATPQTHYALILDRRRRKIAGWYYTVRTHDDRVLELPESALTAATT